MRQIDLAAENIHRGNLILVNQKYPLIPAHRPVGRLRPVVCGQDVLLDNRVNVLLNYVIDKIGASHEIVPVSGYRSKQEQEEIYSESIEENGIEFTSKYVALPGRSEHQTGLAIDLAKKSENIDFICPEFPYSGVCQQFRNTSADYGFIQRYPEEKQRITGIGHEPWHFRYVGYPHSKIMKQYDFVLEEYMEFIKDFPYEGRHYIFRDNKQTMEIFYVDGSTPMIDVPSDLIYQISGNNMDGYIVTLWRQAYG